MLTPVQQTPLAYDPTRQHITPATPVIPTPPVRPADVPVQSSSPPEDQSNTQDGGSKGSPGDQAAAQQQMNETAATLRGALARLTELRLQADAAASTGNTRQATLVAEEAAQVASSIRDATGTVPGTGTAPPAPPPAQPATQSGTGGQDDSGQNPSAPPSAAPPPAPIDAPAIIDLARSGLGSAKDVVDVTASLPQQPIEDSRAIAVYMSQIHDAMAGVEAIAAKISTPTGKTSKSATRIDIKA